MAQRIGIDLGGTKIEGIVLDHDNAPIHRKRVATNKNYHSIVKQIVALIQELLTLAPNATIGMGCPGHIDDTGKVRNSNTQCLNGERLQADIENSLQQTIRVENDANCFALAEALLGAGRNYQNIFAVILGTGVGGGIVINQTLLSGKHHIAGEWGHNVLDPRGVDCYCGKSGCVETFLSGPGMALEFNAQNNTDYTAKDIFKLAENGDLNAIKTRDLYADRLAQALSVIINIIDPDCIVLGGGISNVNYLYSDSVLASVGEHVFHHQWHGRIVKNANGDSAGVIGAALL